MFYACLQHSDNHPPAAMVTVSTTIAGLSFFVLVAIATAVPRPLPVPKVTPILSTQTTSRVGIEYKVSNAMSKFVGNLYNLCKDRRTDDEIFKCIEKRSPLAAYCVRKNKYFLTYCRNEVTHSNRENKACIFYKC